MTVVDAWVPMQHRRKAGRSTFRCDLLLSRVAVLFLLGCSGDGGSRFPAGVLTSHGRISLIGMMNIEIMNFE